jgi:hypothetical protein
MFKSLARGLVRVALWIVKHPNDVVDLVEDAKRAAARVRELQQRGRPAGVSELTIGPGAGEQ